MIRWTAVVAAVLIAAGVLAACASPSLSSHSCTRSPDDDPALAALSSRLLVAGSLRNGEVVPAPNGKRFVSAELHRAKDKFAVAGEILTWVGDGADSFRSVDRNARRLSSWPAARSVDLRDPAARTSRGCVYPYRGHRVCDQQSANAAVATGQCPTPFSTDSTTTTAKAGA